MRRWMHLLAAALLALASLPAQADFHLVVNATNPVHALTQRQAVELYMGRSRSFPGGDFALVFDLPRDHPRRAAFYRALTGMSAAQVNSYWSRLMFAGQSMPPQPLPDEAAMLDLVRRNPSALGWLEHAPADKGLRVVLVLKDEE